MNLKQSKKKVLPEEVRAEHDPFTDFGLGDKVGREPGTRLINNDGSFNVVRKGKTLYAPYQALMEMTWWRLLLVTILTYIAVNLVFAGCFLLIGTDSLTNVEQDAPFWERALGAFFFSVQTFTTVGYGGMAPVGMAANALAALVALFGWIGLAIGTGLFYGRFSRPQRMVLFSDRALVGKYGDGMRALKFRIVNQRDNHLINLTARAVLTYIKDGRRHFRLLKLERDSVPLFPLNWTIVHPIDEDSPLKNWNRKELEELRAELLITIDAYDETFAQTVHDQNSYIYEEIEWNARFEPMYLERDSTTELHLDRIHAFSLEEE